MIVKEILILLTLTVFVSSNVHSRQNSGPTNFYYSDPQANMNMVSHDRAPIVDKIRCNENEYLYPGDNPHDWICDCKPGFIFFPSDGRCYEAYRRGPCKHGEILILSKGQKSPKCIHNQCKKEGLVSFAGKCHELDSKEPCVHFYNLIGRKTFLAVSQKTFELTCADSNRMFECSGICCADHKGDLRCFPKRNKQRKN